MENRDGLCCAFCRRFPKSQKESSLPNPLEKSYALKQSKRTLKKYFEEARYIQKHLPTEIHEQLAEKTIQGLDDDIVKRVTGGILKREKRELDEVLETIQSITAQPVHSGVNTRGKLG